MKDWFAYHILRLPQRASEGAKLVDDLMVYLHWLMLALFIGWSLYFLYVLWRFSVRRNAKADHVGSTSPIPKYTEIAVVLAEAVLLIGVAMPIWARSVDNFPKPEESTVIQVMAQQYAWNARYPGADGKFGRQDMKLITDQNVFGVDPVDGNGTDDIQVFNEIHVPLGKPVLIYLSSKDVIHSFKLVAMRVTQDAIPGLRIPFTFTPTKEGKFQIVCAQLCGPAHAAMAGGFVVVDSPENYDKWLKSKSVAAAAGPASFE